MTKSYPRLCSLSTALRKSDGLKYPEPEHSLDIQEAFVIILLKENKKKKQTL